MKKAFIISLISVFSFAALGQQAVTEAVENRALSAASLLGDVADQVDLALLVNDLVFDVTTVATKAEQCQTKLKILQAIIDNPQSSKYMSASYQLDIIERIQFTSINIKIYGKAVKGLLQAIERNMREHEIALAKRTAVDNGVKDAQQAIAEQAMITALAALRNNPYTAAAGLGQSADLTPVNQKLEESKQKLDAVSRLRKSRETIEGYIDEVNELNDTLDKYMRDIDLLTLGVRAAVGFNVVMIMGVGTEAVNNNRPKK